MVEMILKEGSDECKFMVLVSFQILFVSSCLQVVFLSLPRT